MPLTPDEFDAGRESASLAILFFLRDHAPLAWSVDEIRVELGNMDRFPDWDEIQSVLAALLATNRIEATDAGGTMYYRYNRRLGFRPSGT
jgi:hypothetical protein